MDYQKIKKIAKKSRLVTEVYHKMNHSGGAMGNDYTIVEVHPLVPRKIEGYTGKRLNLLVPSLNVAHVFGGIATALKFYKQLGESMKTDLRVILVDAELDQNAMVEMDGFEVCSNRDDSVQPKQIISFANRYGETFPVGPNDIFMATGWWTAYTIFPVIRWQQETYGGDLHSLLYFIQDYEPGFYPWSSRYLMADSTYKSDIPTIAVFNSKLLYEFFKKNGYQFKNEYYFEPVLNEKLKEELQKHAKSYIRKKQILLYGRPGTARNAFELILASLNEWVQIDDQAGEWTILSAGENFDDVSLVNGQKVKALGKVSLEEYARIMLESKIGISLMVSPHPSYPPLEMSTFGMRVITNHYGNKNLSDFNENMISLDNCSSTSIAETLKKLCREEKASEAIMQGEYFEGKNNWQEVIDGLITEW